MRRESSNDVGQGDTMPSVGKSSRRRDPAEFSGMFWNISLVYKFVICCIYYSFATEYALFQVKPTWDWVSATPVTGTIL